MKQVAVNFNRRQDLMVRRVDWQRRTQLWPRVLDVSSKRIPANLQNATLEFMEMKCKKIPTTSEKRLNLALLWPVYIIVEANADNKRCKQEMMKETSNKNCFHVRLYRPRRQFSK